MRLEFRSWTWTDVSEQTFHSPHSFLSFSIIWNLLTLLFSLLLCVIYFLFHSNQTRCHSAFTCASWYLPWSMGKMLLARLHTSALSTSTVALPEAELLLPESHTLAPGMDTGSSSSFKGSIAQSHHKTCNRSCSCKCLVKKCSTLHLLDGIRTCLYPPKHQTKSYLQ